MTLKVLELECRELMHSNEIIKTIADDFINQFAELPQVKNYRYGLISTFDVKIHEMLEDYIAKYFLANPHLETYNIFIRVFDNDEEYDKYFNNMVKYAPKNLDYINHLEAYQFNDKLTDNKINVSFIGMKSNNIERLKEWNFYVLIKI